MIGDIEVKVTGCKGDYVKLGISAPKEVLIYRKEIYDAIHSQNIAASQVEADDINILTDLIKS